MKLDLYTYSSKGARELNEDYCDKVGDDNRCILVLCDGLGGYDCGEVASKNAAKSLIDSIKQAPAVNDESLSEAMNTANDKLLDLQKKNPAQKGMRTTAVGCVLENETLRFFNCGDSRFYYFSNGALSAMSEDHSVPQMLVKTGDKSFDDIRFSADRNKLLSVLGQETDGTRPGTVYPPIACKPGDAFLLCSDGFWEYVLEEEMEIDLSKAQTAAQWCEFMLVRLLLKFSAENDNFTVMAGIIA